MKTIKHITKQINIAGYLTLTKRQMVKRYISNFCKGRTFNFSKLIMKYATTKQGINTAIKELIAEGFMILTSEDTIVCSRI